MSSSKRETKINLGDISCQREGEMELAQVHVLWWILISAVFNLRVLLQENYLQSVVCFSFPASLALKLGFVLNSNKMESSYLCTYYYYYCVCEHFCLSSYAFFPSGSFLVFHSRLILTFLPRVQVFLTFLGNRDKFYCSWNSQFVIFTKRSVMPIIWEKSVYLRFEVLTAMVMKRFVFWDITPCSPLKVNRRFGGTCRIHLQGRRINQARNQHESCSLAYSSTLKMEATCFSETSVDFQQTTRHYIPEDRTFQINLYLKPYDSREW
jgi:hypothetical protein